MTPHTVTPIIKKLLNTLNTQHKAQHLSVEAEPDAEISDCFVIVKKKVEKEGGKMILGWLLWEEKYYVTAECHAVWENQEGKLKEITPKDFGINKVFFVIDEALKYEDKQIDNIRLNSTQNSLVDDLIEIEKAMFRFQNAGERAYYHGVLDDILTTEEMIKWNDLAELRNNIWGLVKHNNDRGSFCFCNSSRKYRDCHGKDLKKRLRTI